MISILVAKAAGIPLLRRTLIMLENEQRSKIEKIFAALTVLEWPSMGQALGEFKASRTATPGLNGPPHSYKISAITV
ncbi:hypothetical protein TVAG_522520 [Trichomonas vaginalis G3]|uniref:Uncharacterized protein n=1 Tax=Trichomonas vaginalis (strain ATCC PRA-98 / G3) TaxID=412133 RepID=A2GZX7_TRIV3|nr:hypothetical protein TVAG_522520 [Trichomonas vaginalis G3]|eukprot:XP_001290220.1 hypothetical protein [Trichomonas vaginalis G3]